MRHLAAILLALAACNEPGPPLGSTAVDCTKIAEALATFEHGPDAPPAVRTAAVARHQAACKAAALTPTEATCIGKATDTWSAIGCAPRMFRRNSRDTLPR